MTGKAIRRQTASLLIFALLILTGVTPYFSVNYFKEYAASMDQLEQSIDGLCPQVSRTILRTRLIRGEDVFLRSYSRGSYSRYKLCLLWSGEQFSESIAIKAVLKSGHIIDVIRFLTTRISDYIHDKDGKK